MPKRNYLEMQMANIINQFYLVEPFLCQVGTEKHVSHYVSHYIKAKFYTIRNENEKKTFKFHNENVVFLSLYYSNSNLSQFRFCVNNSICVTCDNLSVKI